MELNPLKKWKKLKLLKINKKKKNLGNNIAEDESAALMNHNFFKTPTFEKNEFIEDDKHEEKRSMAD